MPWLYANCVLGIWISDGINKLKIKLYELNEPHLLKTTTSHYYNSQGKSEDMGTGLSLATEKPFFFFKSPQYFCYFPGISKTEI